MVCEQVSEHRGDDGRYLGGMAVGEQELCVSGREERLCLSGELREREEFEYGLRVVEK